MFRTLLAAGLAGLCLSAVSAHATTIRPKLIYGNDDRLDYYQISEPSQRRAADATVAVLHTSDLTERGPVTDLATDGFGEENGLCASEPYYHQDTAAFCSGFLVTPDTVVTAGHCISNQASCDNTRFVFDFKLTSADAQPRSVPTDRVFKCKQFVHSVSFEDGEDFAVVKLDRTVTHVAPVTLRRQGRPAVGDPLHLIGYPAGLPLKLAGGARVRSLEAQYLVANLDSYGGNSGSAVFNSATGEVEGVLVRGDVDFIYSHGCYTSNRCKDDGCRGEDVTLIERVLPFLDGEK